MLHLPRFICIAICVLPLSGIALADDETADDEKVFSAAVCQPRDSKHQKLVRFTGQYLANRSSTETATVVCGLTRDNTTSRDGIEFISVRFNDMGKIASCSLISCTKYGTACTFDNGSTAGTGRNAIRLTVNKSERRGFYSVECQLPPEARLYSIRLWER
jgi:hypothetical protein